MDIEGAHSQARHQTSWIRFPEAEETHGWPAHRIQVVLVILCKPIPARILLMRGDRGATPRMDGARAIPSRELPELALHEAAPALQ
jgi:hypothetical protein